MKDQYIHHFLMNRMFPKSEYLKQSKELLLRQGCFISEVQRAIDLEMKRRELEEYQRSFENFVMDDVDIFKYVEVCGSTFTVFKDDFGYYIDVYFNNILQKFRWISPGEVLVNSTVLGKSCYRKIGIKNGYWLADTVCTQELYMSIVNSYRFIEKKSMRVFQGNQYPVSKVSYKDIMSFIEILNRQASVQMKFRLPTGMEWEYACRAGTVTRYSFGDRVTEKQINCTGSIQSVKSYPCNSWGLFEMHGNVWEFCTNIRLANQRMLRGGSAFNSKLAMRSEYLGAFMIEGDTGVFAGFRLVLSEK